MIFLGFEATIGDPREALSKKQLYNVTAMANCCVTSEYWLSSSRSPMKSLRVSVISFALSLASLICRRVFVPLHANICFAIFLTHYPCCLCCPSAMSMLHCLLLAAV